MAATDRKSPTLEQRRKGLDHAVAVVTSQPFHNPGAEALKIAEDFAQYLANGPAAK